MKLLFDEGLSPRLVGTLADLFPGSETALRNGLAGQGDLRILSHAVEKGFVLVTTDSDFLSLASRYAAARIVVLRACNYPTEVAGDVLRRNAIRISELVNSERQVLVLDR
jgi:predicted nuclease of predicted toxin-antitoxin system